MKISTTSTVCAAAVLVSGVSGQRLLQGVPQAGLDVTAPVASVDSSQVADGAGVEEKLVQTLQADPQVTGKTIYYCIYQSVKMIVNHSVKPSAVVIGYCVP